MNMPDQNASPKKVTIAKRGGWRLPLALLGATAMLSMTSLLIFFQGQSFVQNGVKESAEWFSNAAQKADSLAGKFKQGQITQRFIASLPRIEGGGSGKLELATLESTEQFRSEDNLRIGWNTLSLGTTISEISVPVIYRYHLQLDESWQLSISNQSCLVVAPRIRPTLPPSIDTGRMKKSTQNGWARFNAEDQLAQLEKSLTATLAQYAQDDQRLALVREEARKTVSSFVRNWLLQESSWREDRFYNVIVRFADETETIKTARLFGDEDRLPQD